MRKVSRGVLLLLVGVLALSTSALADEPIDTGESGEPQVESYIYVAEKDGFWIEGREVVEPVVTEEGLTISQADVPFDSESESALIQSAVADFGSDIKKGLDNMYRAVPVLDSIELENWGEFLATYAGRNITEMPIGDISFKIGQTNYTLKSSKTAKEWVFNKLLPALKQELAVQSMAYPCDVYVYNAGDSGTPLEGFTPSFENENLIKGYSVYPMIGKSNEVSTDFSMGVYETGVSYGISMNKEYISVLRSIAGEEGVYKALEDKEIPSCVNMLARVVTLKNLSGYTLEDKYIRDMQLYNNLAVNLMDGKLYDVASIDSGDLRYKDENLDIANLYVVNLQDGVVVLQTKYLECFYYDDMDLNTGCKVDIVPFLENGQAVLVGTDTEPISSYVTEDGMFVVGYGNSYPFLVHVNGNAIPFGRIISWLYSDAYSARMTKDTRDKMSADIKSIMKEAGRADEWKEYMEAAGQSTFPMGIVVGVAVGVLIIAGGIVAFVLIRRKKKKVNPQPDFMFSMEEHDEADGGFVGKPKDLPESASGTSFTFGAEDSEDDN